MNELGVLEKSKSLISDKTDPIFETPLDLIYQIDEDGRLIKLKEKDYLVEEDPILLCDFADSYELSEKEDSKKKTSPFKDILDKINKSRARPDRLKSDDQNIDENFSTNVKSKDYFTDLKFSDNLNEKYEESNKIDYSFLKEKIKNLSDKNSFLLSNQDLNQDFQKFSIFLPDEEIFSSILSYLIILFLKPIFDLNISVFEKSSEINLDLFEYIKLYLKKNELVLIDVFCEEFLLDKLNFSNKDFAMVQFDRFYKKFLQSSYNKFENLNMSHFKFLEKNIIFFNSILQYVVFFILNINFNKKFSDFQKSEDLKSNVSLNIFVDNIRIEIKNFLENFFKKINFEYIINEIIK